ncbi:MAG: hypothetical protein JZU50_01205 [Desulfobulbaceae bacterium]|nr:hypothetical protein [Desulfobulbaceae bacterium]
MKTNYVLIDYENVQVKSLALLKGEQFRVRVFLGPNNTKLPVELVLAMQDLGDRGEYVVLETPGANALDFHIAYYLGALAATDPSGFFHIISKDTGFDSLIKHLKAKKVFSTRSASVEEMPCFVPASAIGDGTKSGVIESKQNTTLARTSIEELIKIAVNDLIKRKASKPRTPKTLLSTIHAKCGKDIPVAQIESVYKGLVKHGYVKVNGTKVSYTLPAVQL